MTQHTFTAEPNSLELTSTFIFDAPREQVYAAYTNPELTPKWWGPEGVPLKVEKLEARPDGSWRFTSTIDGKAFDFRGVYHTATAPERLVFTWQYEGSPTVAMETVVFEELPDGKTKLVDQLVFQSVADRDDMIKSGMDEGSMREMMERLAKLV